MNLTTNQLNINIRNGERSEIGLEMRITSRIHIALDNSGHIFGIAIVKLLQIIILKYLQSCLQMKF